MNDGDGAVISRPALHTSPRSGSGDGITGQQCGCHSTISLTYRLLYKRHPVSPRAQPETPLPYTQDTRDRHRHQQPHHHLTTTLSRSFLMSTNPAISGTGISVATDRVGSHRVFYQLLDGHINGRGNRDGTRTSDHLTLSPVSASPLASVTFYSQGKQEVSSPSPFPVFPAPRPDSHGGRFACITLTPDTLSKNLPSSKGRAGIKESLARWKP